MRYWVNELEFSDKKKISFEKDDIVILVGPNNAGKSASLKEIMKLVTKNGDNSGSVINTLKLEKEGTLSNFVEFTKRHTRFNSTNRNYSGYKCNFHENMIHQNNLKPHWESELRLFTNLFFNHLETKDRLNIVHPPNRLAESDSIPSNPYHLLEKDDNLINRFSSYFKKAFGKELTFQRFIGNKTPLHVGKIDSSTVLPNDYSSLGKHINNLPKLEEQGDGMKSFMGTLLSGFSTNHSVVLIDEPEAFLHPPQARLLGQMIGNELPKNKQLFIATHSIDLLKGILNSNSSRVKILRIRREGNINHITHLNSTEIKSIWTDPLLKYSNILNSIFHDAVFLCEGDVDCTFYSIILNKVKGNDNKDYLFLHCGGKDRMHTVIQALRKLNVPIRVIADIDILNQGGALEKVVKSLGGDWTTFQPEWKRLNEFIKITPKKAGEISRNLKAILNEVDKNVDSNIEFPKDKKAEIFSILKNYSGWKAIKLGGKSAIKSGDSSKLYNSLIEKSEKINLFIVEVGEVENFIKTVGNHGPKWLIKVIEQDKINSQESKNAENFIKNILIKAKD